MLRLTANALKLQTSGLRHLRGQNVFGSGERIAGFRSTPPLNIHPAFLLIAKQLTKGLAVLTGRVFRKWWRDLPPDKRAHFVGAVSRNKGKIFVTCAAFVAAGGLYYVSHVQETPITKRRRFVAFTPEQFNKISQYEFEMQYEMYKPHLLPSSHPAYARVTRVANRLLRANTDVAAIHEASWSVSVVQLPLQNAFVLPSGQIFVFRGMLDLCQNDEQLGAVLAHEMAHCILGHGAEQISYAHLLDIVIIVFLAAIWAVMPTDAVAAFAHWFFNRVVNILLQLPYSRKLELEADEVGLQLAAKACFDVRESSAFWSKMSLISDNDPQVEFLSTHPNHDRRSEHLDNLMNEALEIRRQYRCADLPPKDPRTLLTALKRELKAYKDDRLPGVVVLQTPK